MTVSFTVMGVEGVPLIKPGDDLAAVLIAAVDDQDIQPLEGDIFVIAQKIVSKAEGRLVDLSVVDPSAEASKLAAETDKKRGLRGLGRLSHGFSRSSQPTTKI